jgi:AcrR family transcriptional regulator
MGTGRPREFDLDRTLDRAVQLFWRQGYEGTAIGELTEALGINRPSLYAAFGNKESLFRRVLQRYADQRAGYLRESLAEPTARQVVAGLVRGAADATTGPGLPRGCLGVQGALASGPGGEVIKRKLISWRRSAEAEIRARFGRARDEGDLPAGADPGELARYVCSVMYGISVQAAGGATRSQLRRVAELTISSWDALVAASAAPSQ